MLWKIAVGYNKNVMIGIQSSKIFALYFLILPKMTQNIPPSAITYDLLDILYYVKYPSGAVLYGHNCC